MGNTGTDVCLAGSDHREISGAARKNEMYRVVTADEYLKDVYTEDASLPGKVRKCPVYFPDDRTNRNNGDKNEHA